MDRIDPKFTAIATATGGRNGHTATIGGNETTSQFRHNRSSCAPDDDFHSVHFASRHGAYFGGPAQGHRRLLPCTHVIS